jgi:type IV pilus assembly protein PilQ
MNTLLAMHAATGTPAADRFGPRWAALLALLTPFLLGAPTAVQAAPALQDIEFAALSGNRVQIDLVLSAAPKPPEHFSTDSPARIALDFPGVTSDLKNKTVPVGVGVVHSVVAVEAGDRTRVVINLNESVPYEVATRGDRVTISVNTQQAAAAPAPGTQPEAVPPQAEGPAAAPGGRQGPAPGAQALVAGPGVVLH